MLATLEATMRPDEYVYAVVSRDHPVVSLAAATITEDEGLTVCCVARMQTRTTSTMSSLQPG